MLLTVCRFFVAATYDKEFRYVIADLAGTIALSFGPADHPPSVAAVWCRHFFSELEL